MVFLCGICRGLLNIGKIPGVSGEISGHHFIDNGIDPIVGTNCGHLFHKRCLSIRKQRDGTHHQKLFRCPQCNKAVESDELHEIRPRPRSASSLSSFNGLSRNSSTDSGLDFAHTRSHSQELADFEPENGAIRNEGAFCNITRRSYLRKKIIELKELEGGITPGCRVICFPDDPEEGTIKWLGKINQIIYIGVEFDEPIGNNFPETNGAAPFPCKRGYGRLVLRNDLILAAELYRGQNMKKIDLNKTNTSFDSQTSSDAFSDAHVSEFSEKLNDFYETSAEINSLLETTRSKLEMLWKESLPSDVISISILLERTKSHVNELEQRNSQVEICKNKSEELYQFPDILLPSEERRINRTLDELINVRDCVQERLSSRIHLLEESLDSCQTIQLLLNDKLDWLSGTKSQLRQMDKDLIATEAQLSKRIDRVESLLQSFSPCDSDEMLEVTKRLSNFRKAGADVRKFEDCASEIAAIRNQTFDEIQIKFESLKEAHKLFRHFVTSVTNFDEWYEEYMLKICEIKAALGDNGQGKGHPVIDPSHPDLVYERENKRIEFLDILRTARQLRVSIFDPSVLDDKLQGLQTRWRSLMENIYRDRGRKTV